MLRRFLIVLFLLSSASGAPPAALKPFLEQHCYDCHDADTKKGGLDLDALPADLRSPETLAKWTQLHDLVATGEMPPKKKPQPPQVERSAFTGVLAQSLTQWDAALKGTIMRRLNRTEYENTLRDLLGVRTQLADLLPEDGKAFGFDNVGEALDLSPVHLQRYMDAAKAALRDAVKFGPPPEKKKVAAVFDAGNNKRNFEKSWLKLDDGSVVFFNSGNFPSIVPEFAAPAEGIYRLTVTGRAHQTDENVTFSIYAGTFGRDNDSHLLDLVNLPPKQASRTLEVFLRQRERVRIYTQLVPDQVSLQKNGPSNYKGPGLALMPVEIEGPIVDEWPGRGHRLLFGELEARAGGAGPKGKFAKAGASVGEIIPKDAAADVKRLLNAFMPAAFRRPVSVEKAAPYVQLAQDELTAGTSFHDAMITAYVAALCSPDFLYLREPMGKLDDFALASRLSYMLWSTAPDAELIATATKGRLSDAATLRAQTERLLSDPRASRFIKSFTGQWLNLREIDFTVPDKQLYPEFNDVLKTASVKETELFFEEVLRGNLSVANFIDSDWTLLNEPLARLYGISGVSGVSGMDFRKVALKPEHHRGGVMTHASVLKVSANGTSTSPVVRGVWVLERILGKTPPPPPPGVPGVEPDIRGAQTLRQQLDKHRSMESCNGCHRVIDPPGFALENYDVIGGWRENYRSLGKDFPKPANLPSNVKNVQWRIGPAVDATGTTPDGRPFKDLAEYKKIILAQPARFTRTLAEKLAVYGTGRGMGFSDRSELDRISTSVAAKGNGFRDLIHEVVQSSIFKNK
ncbi:DUF1592 domain-containing protein [Prosthecobacter sp.]|uniref:DUF1592 domain-containing protein n=1 Tax=Prosthecobacter sp. TaxID=1965333 RepID=UPI003782F6FA